ncbi:MAG: 4-hydroxythreonine-4-phosphate dehydrogenase PdxA [Bacteroidota bacterium]
MKDLVPNKSPKIGITIGDINGIGPEVIIKALRDNRLTKYLIPVVYGSTKVLSYYKKSLHLEDFQYSQVNPEFGINPKKTNVVNCWQEMIEIEAGSDTKPAGIAALKALQKAGRDVKKGIIDALVTAPINKGNIQSEEFNFPGHTEFFADLTDQKDSLMLMVSKTLRVGVATGHIPLKQIPESITKEGLRSKLTILINTLKTDFGINKPKVAVLGLNPHAGEEGLLGSEENEIIRPLIKEFKNEGHLAFGPFPADGFFARGEFKKFDGILAMYHDQGLIPFKTLAYQSGVNYTAGLPIIRTSPDHGTAYNLAGKGIADESSMRSAIMTAYDILNSRKMN